MFRCDDNDDQDEKEGYETLNKTDQGLVFCNQSFWVQLSVADQWAHCATDVLYRGVPVGVPVQEGRSPKN